ncbi:MAG: ATP-binding protein [Candidatus Margulisiibacteriota bacterium]
MPDLNVEQQLVIQDIKTKFSWSIIIRYVVAIISAILLFVSGYSGSISGTGIYLILYLFSYNIFANLIVFFKKHFSLLQIVVLGWLFQLLDLVSITFLIYITGWLESPYWFLYLVLIILSGFGVFSYYSISVLIIAFISTCFYLGLLFAAYFKFLPVYGPDFRLTPQELLLSIYNKAVFASIAFFLLAITIYYFSKLLNQQREELTARNLKLTVALEKMKDVDRLKDEFVATASHELRTPLSVIRENVALIKDGITGSVNEKQLQLLISTHANIDRLAGILNNLLDVSKIESHLFNLNRQPCDLCQIAKCSIDFMTINAQKKNITLKLTCPQKSINLIDQEQISRVFINLIDNAIKYSPDNTVINISIEDNPTQSQVSIEDQSNGIASEDLPKLFERFVHIRKDTNAAAEGSGLGLSICKGIIELHGGKIWAESKLGVGNKFIFTLPKIGE